MTASHSGFVDLLPSIHFPSLFVTTTNFTLAGDGPPLSPSAHLLGFQGPPQTQTLRTQPGRTPSHGCPGPPALPSESPPHTSPRPRGCYSALRAQQPKALSSCLGKEGQMPCRWKQGYYCSMITNVYMHSFLFYKIETLT